MKKIILVSFIFMFAFANSAWAHTGLESSNPESGQVVTEELNEISLNFEGKIEQSSTFELLNSNGESIPVENISINENQMIGTLAMPLVTDSYEIAWMIVGADGHPIEGTIPFTVEISSAETTEDEEVEQAETIAAPSTDQIDETEEDESSSNIIPIIVIALIVIIGGVFFWLRRKK
ncbi:copper resistance protein CopC [Psychrobacillus sp. FJAT-51614]|uniref:Copper resistance protein CopC n=1 Tax=Psychrobacillus mangrovi TaxID=3117745 RepID=A0ABU8F898_9BACI